MSKVFDYYYGQPVILADEEEIDTGIVDLLLEAISTSKPLILPEEKKCTCGAAAVDSSMHSDWCDLGGNN